jgi:hypothetical protein
MESSTQGIPDVTPSRWLTLLESRAARAGLVAVTLVAGLGIKLSMATPASADGPLDGLTERVSRTAEERLTPQEKKPERAREERPEPESERSRTDDARDAIVVSVESVRTVAEPAVQAVVEAAAPVTSSVGPVLEQAAPAREILSPVIETVQPVVDTQPMIGAVEQVVAPVVEVLPPVAEVLPPIVEMLPPVVIGPEIPSAAPMSPAAESVIETLPLPSIEVTAAPADFIDAASSARAAAPAAQPALASLQAEGATAVETATADGAGLAAPAASFGQAEQSSTRGAVAQRPDSPLPRFERVDPSFASLPLWGMVIALAWLVLGGSRRTSPRTWQSQLFTPPR